MNLYALNLAHPWTAHAVLLRLASGPGRVLEVGCASGHLTQRLRESGASVTAVELDPDAAERARPHSARLVVGSIEDSSVLGAVSGRYDRVLLADILEHLRDPAAVLRAIRPWLEPDGMLITSIPNIANWRIRWKLLRGEFTYTDEGILDRTHLCFFTRRTAEAMLEGAGFRVEAFHPAATRMPRLLVRARPELFAVHLIHVLRVAR